MLANVANDNAGCLTKPTRFTLFASKLAPTAKSSRPFVTIVGCIGHRAGLYCRAFLASRLHHLACLGKVASADRCNTEATFIECSLIEERDS